MQNQRKGDFMHKIRTPIPAEMKRELRREAYYGCINCGCPIVEYHHIVPWHIVKEHDKENLVAICPTCHHRATCNELTTDRIKYLKANPHNKTTMQVSQDFFINKHQDLTLKIGSMRFVNATKIIQICDDVVLSLDKDDDGYALLNMEIHDIDDRLIAKIVDNEWTAYLENELWDIVYKPGLIKIYSSSRKNWLEFGTEQGKIQINGFTYYHGYKVVMNNKGIAFYNKSKDNKLKDPKFTIRDGGMSWDYGTLLIPIFLLGESQATSIFRVDD